MRKSDDRQKLIAGEGRWFRFSDYEVVRSAGGFAQHVRPTKDAKVSYYRPFDVFHQIMLDYLRLGSDLSFDMKLPDDLSDEEATAKFKERSNRNAVRIIAFARKYGLPGLLWQCEPNVDHSSGYDRETSTFKSDYTHVYVPNSLWSTSLATPFERPYGYLEAKEFLKHFLVDRFNISSVVGFRQSVLAEYAEPIDSIVRDAVDFLRNQNEWERFRDGRYAPSDRYIYLDGRLAPPSYTWDQSLQSQLSASSVALHIVFDSEYPRLDYGFPSLIGALRIMATLNALSSGEGRVRICALKECNQAFIALKARGKFCSTSHNNVNKQREFMKRNPNYYKKKRIKTSKKRKGER